MTGLLRYAGLIAAPLAWAVSTEIGQIAPYADCAARANWTLFGASLALALGTAGAALSLVGARAASVATDRFVGQMSAAAGFVIAFALCLQTFATVVIDPCVR